MGLCIDCREDDAGALVPHWQYRTVNEPCDRCGAEFSHVVEFE